MNFKILFIEHEGRYISGKKYTFKDFMSGKINEINNRLPTEKDLATHLSTIFTENRLKNILNLDPWMLVVGIVYVQVQLLMLV